MKKNLLLLFAALLPLVASAHDFEVDGLNYTILSSEDKTVSIARGNIEPTGDLYIPATVIYEEFEYRVIEIGNNAFENCTNLTSAKLTPSIHTIGIGAFEGCTSLSAFDWANAAVE